MKNAEERLAALEGGVEPISASDPDVFNVRATDALLPLEASFSDDLQVKELMTGTW